MNINQSIQELLYEHECVIIPQFGGFVTNYKPAFVHPKKHLIFPPSKQVSFNVNLKNNDGLLANYISQKENVSYQVALEYVQSAVSKFSEKLKIGKRLSVEGVGTISVNESGSLEFAPEDIHNFLRSSFGLKPVFLPTLEELAPAATPVAIEEAEPVQETPVVPISTELDVQEILTTTTPKRKFNRKWIAAAAFLPLMYFGGMTVQQNSVNISSFFSSLLPSKTIQKEAIFNPRLEGESIQFTYGEPISQLELIAAQNPELQAVFYSFETGEISPNGLKVILAENASSNSSESTNTNYNKGTSSLELYFIVAGCFKEKNNAESLVKKLRRKGFDAGIFGKKGSLHMVCYGSFTNRNAAKMALTEIQDAENPGAWLKKH